MTDYSVRLFGKERHYKIFLLLFLENIVAFIFLLYSSLNPEKLFLIN